MEQQGAEDVPVIYLHEIKRQYLQGEAALTILDNAKLALCFVRMGQYREAVDAATKANAVPTWKEVNIACLNAGEFRLRTSAA